MRGGELIDDRFALDVEIGSGGMGTVWRALDRATGAPVALKLLRDPEEGDAARFVHEARILAGFTHPQVIRHIGHGLLPTGKPYLVMEWFDGEDLSARLARGALSLDESLKLVRLVADALGAAHARGIVHRDIKPSNLFLVGGEVARVKVLDFGVARSTGATTHLTQTGSILGTPGYMAPEQARGDHEIGPRADVFSLGAVLFECVTGQPAFQGSHVMALLAKLLLEEPPRLVDARPGTPPAVSDLCERMLSKEPSARPADAAEVVAALDEIAAASGAPGAPQHSAKLSPISRTERRLLSIVAIASPPEEPARPLDATMDEADAPRSSLMTVCEVVESLGASANALADGTILVVLSGASNPTDQAARAARCALRLHALLPRAGVVLVTGHAEVTARVPLGEIVERVATLLDRTGASAGARLPGVVLDDVTRALLDTRFEVAETEGRALLMRERMLGDEPRTLLGKPSLFVGRERELRSLCEMLEEGFEDRSARALLVTAPAGGGKSRLRQELLRRLRDRYPDTDMVLAIGRADSLGAGSAFALLGSAVRTALGIGAGEPLEVQRSMIAALSRRLFKGDPAERVAEFLGEIVGAPFPDDRSPRLRAARQNAQIMADQIEAAYLDFSRAVARDHAVLLVLEDLHWGDAASVKLLDTTLRELHDEPIAVLAFARPDVHERFPKLWAERSAQEVRLGPLPRRAAEGMVRAALGGEAAGELVTALVERSGGNAFYLEELIRAVAEGRGEELPETVLGMVEARLAALPPEARRFLRAASVFGEVFWKSGVLALLGEGAAASADASLAYLVEHEFVARRSEPRRSGREEVHAFRHALVREGAYAMLTERDRQVGHGLAGAWLEGAGELDPVVLAAHFERGGELSRAAHWHAQAAARALRGNDLPAALSWVERGLSAKADGETAAELWALWMRAAYLVGNNEQVVRAAEEVMRRAEPGSSSYCQALGSALASAMALGWPEALSRFMALLLSTEPAPGAVPALAWAFAPSVNALLAVGQRETAARYLRRLLAFSAGPAGEEPSATAWVALSRAFWERNAERNPWAALPLDAASERHFERAGDLHYISFGTVFRGLDCALLGAFEEADGHFRRVLERERKRNVIALIARVYLSYVRLEEGALDEAITAARLALEEGEAQRETMASRQAGFVLVEARLLKGELDAAEEALGDAASVRSAFLTNDTWARGLRAKLLLARGRAAEAAGYAGEVIAMVREAGVFDPMHASLLLTRAEALFAAGDMDGARAAIREARADVLERAARIEERAYRQSFLERIPAHVRTLLKAREWLGEGHL